MIQQTVSTFLSTVEVV